MTLIVGAATLGAVDRAVHDIHAPTPTVRRIIVTSLEQSAGASTVAALMARTLARHRGGRVLLTGAPAIAGDFAELPAPTDDERATLAPDLTGDVRPWHGAWRASAPIDDRSFDVSVVDGGHLRDPARAHVHLAGAHAVVLVASFERAMGEQALVLADALSAHADGAAAIVAFVNRQRSRSTWPRLICDRHPRAVAVLPYDSALATSEPDHSSTADSSTATRRGMLTVAGAALVAQRSEAGA